MTVSTDKAKETFDGDGATNVFPCSFRIFEKGDVEVSVDGVVQILDTDYQVTNITDSGFDVDFSIGTAPSSGSANVVVRRSLDFTQETDYREADPFPAASHEDALDRLTMLAQQLDEAGQRALKASLSETSIENLPAPADRRNKFLKFENDASADPTAVGATELGSGLVLDEDDFDSNSATDAASQQSIEEYINRSRRAVKVTTEPGADLYKFDIGLDIAIGDVITLDFNSANTTANPTLENLGGSVEGFVGNLSIVPPSGAAYIGMIQARPHQLQWDGSSDWQLLDPAPLHIAPSSTNPGLTFDTWRTPNADRPTLVLVNVTAITDGTTAGRIFLDVDESGGTTADYQLNVAFAHDNLPANTQVRQASSFYIPPGGSYQLNNDLDPTGSNSITSIREFVL